jgi:hypothetical protein
MKLTLEELVGRNIAAARTESGGGREWLSQEALGQRLAFYLGKPWTKQAVSDAENGRRRFDPTELIAFAYALEHTSVVDLLAAGPEDSIHLPGEAPDIPGDSLRWVVLPADLANATTMAELEREAARIDRMIVDLHMRLSATETGRRPEGEPQ